MQAAARSYRLNQTHAHCKVVYLYAEGTMEQTAVQLMSRKQRAAKLLTGDIGLTGLDALTEGEGGFEEALLAAIGRDVALLDPAQLFKSAGAVGEIDAEDAAYWNVEDARISEDEQIVVSPDPLVVAAVEQETSVVAAVEQETSVVRTEPPPEARIIPSTAADYLDTVTLIMDGAKWRKLKTEALNRAAEETEAELSDWLRENRIVFPGCEREVGLKLCGFLDVRPASPAVQPVEPPVSETPTSKPASKAVHKIVPFPQSEPGYDDAPARQLALF